MCFPVAGMVKRALIECTEKGAFPKQWEDCALLSEARQIYSKICAHYAQKAASQYLCVRPPCTRALLPVRAVNLGYFQSGVERRAGGLGPAAGCLRRKPEQSPRIRGNWCACRCCAGCCKCAGLRWTRIATNPI